MCGRVSKANRAHAEAEERKIEREKALAEFAASPLGRMQAHLRRTLEAYGITASNELETPLCYRAGWIFADDPLSYRAPDMDDLFILANQIGIDMQELLFGNPEGALKRELAQGVEQAVAAPQPAPIWHPYPAERPAEGQMVLALSHSKYNRDNYAAYIFRAGGWYLPELPEDGLVTPDVRWWSAELAPESEDGE